MTDVNMTGNSHVNAAAIYFTAFHMVIGIPGNVVVLYIFVWRFQASPFHVLVSTLAAIDLLVCMIIMPADLFVSASPLSVHVHSVLCKTLAFFIGLTTFTSIIIFLAIAYFRYRSICNPHGSPVRLLDAKMATVLAVLLAGISNCLAPVTFGSRRASRGGTAQHLECGVTEQAERFYATLYYSVVFALVSVTTSALGYCYVRVGVVLWRRARVKPFAAGLVSGLVSTSPASAGQSDSRSANCPVPLRTHLLPPDLTETHTATEQLKRARDTNIKVTDSETKFPSTTCKRYSLQKNEMPDLSHKSKDKHTRIPVCLSTLTHCPAERGAPQQTWDTSLRAAHAVSRTSLLAVSCHPHRQQAGPIGNGACCQSERLGQTVRAVVLVVVLNVVFLAAYVPHAAMMTMYAVLRFGDYQVALGTDVFSVCIRSPYLSNICNPFIFGLGSGEFRKELKFVVNKMFAVFHLRTG